MPITSVTRDPEALTMTVVADFAASRQRVWEAYTDPRQIEKFWGPPTWPATFHRHDVTPGGRSHFVMRGPDGTLSAGFWEFLSVEPGVRIEVRDGFADAEGREDDRMPSMRMALEFEDIDGGCRLTATTWFASTEQLQQLLEMGMEEGMTAAMGQIDDVLADLTSFAASRAADAQLLDDTRVRVSRVIRGSVAQVWDAHHDATLLRRWLLGPDGWTMPVCEVASAVGERYRYEWAPDGAEGEPFGFVGEVLESDPPRREVTTQQMIGVEGDPNINALTLTPRDGATLLTVVITFPSREVRDMVLDARMTEGMEASYRRLEEQLAG